MPARYDLRLIMMVSQKSFETSDMNQFCKLLPMIYADGTRPEATDFPNDGEIWWMLTAQTARLANPGQLVVGMVENAVRYEEDDPMSSMFQVVRDSVNDLSIKDGIEVVEMRGDAIDSIEDVVAGEPKLTLDFRPAPVVFVRWRAQVYGPFTASLNPHAVTAGDYAISIVPANSTDMTIYRLDADKFDEVTRDFNCRLVGEVSLSADRRCESYELAEIKHDVILRAGYERVLALNPEKMVLEPLDKKLIRYSRECLSRKRRQELQAILKELEISGTEQATASDLVGAIGRVRQATEKQDAALNVVAQALLTSGLLGDERLGKAERAAAEKYVQDRSAELQAKAEEAVNERREEIRRLESSVKTLKTKLQKEENESRARLKKELDAEREKAHATLAAERKELERQKAELAKNQKVLQTNLEAVTKELREAGDSVVNRYMTIAPFLGVSGLLPGPANRLDNATNVPEKRHETASFEIPAYAAERIVSESPTLPEKDFFERFCRVVEESGFTYRPLDLQRFHHSVKCGEITVLGGPSGTGKSTLPLLYALALLGDEAEHGRPGCLMINVNPSWLDARDLLGHMNSLDGKFYPAESGLFQYLVIAQAEHERCGAASGLHMTCLDEMNLSQVEHYFSDFMMVLERNGPARAIQCFPPDASSTDCPFRNWDRVKLSPALRFIGTVNFDETTRLLSDRLLDRVNLIRLKSPALPRVAAAGAPLAHATGRMVTLADMQAWCTDSALPADLASVLDRIRPPLSQIGCPISPRVYRAICRAVSSAGSAVMSPSKTFDTQLAQRIIPRIRSLVTRRQVEALDQLMEILKQSNTCTFEESLSMLEDTREAASMRGWNLEE